MEKISSASKNSAPMSPRRSKVGNEESKQASVNASPAGSRRGSVAKSDISAVSSKNELK